MKANNNFPFRENMVRAVEHMVPENPNPFDLFHQVLTDMHWDRIDIILNQEDAALKAEINRQLNQDVVPLLMRAVILNLRNIEEGNPYLGASLAIMESIIAFEHDPVNYYRTELAGMEAFDYNAATLVEPQDATEVEPEVITVIQVGNTENQIDEDTEDGAAGVAVVPPTPTPNSGNAAANNSSRYGSSYGRSFYFGSIRNPRGR